MKEDMVKRTKDQDKNMEELSDVPKWLYAVLVGIVIGFLLTPILYPIFRIKSPVYCVEANRTGGLEVSIDPTVCYGELFYEEPNLSIINITRSDYDYIFGWNYTWTNTTYQNQT